MYRFEQLIEQNLPIYIEAQRAAEISTSWPKQLALFGLITTACLTGFLSLSHYTYTWGFHSLPPLGLTIDPFIMMFNTLFFFICVVCLALWLQEETKTSMDVSVPIHTQDEMLNYIFPASHSLHLKHHAWDLTSAHRVIIDYPERVVVEFKNPDLNFVIKDDGTGYEEGLKKNTVKALHSKHNAALFVYLSGVDLPNRYIRKPNWWWNLGAGLFFAFTITLPFLFQAVGLKLYWIGFLAIPVSYLAFRVGQKEFRRYEVFSYADFLEENIGPDKNIFRKLLL